MITESRRQTTLVMLSGAKQLVANEPAFVVHDQILRLRTQNDSNL